jgi:AraC-like DNA-binding protein
MLIRDASANGPMVPSICESLTQLLFQKIRQLRLPKGSVMPKAYGTYERIRRHIEENFLRLHTAQDVAEECEITPVYLSRLFGRFSDCGAYQYLLRRKMNYAAGLLMNEGLLVKDVAQRLQFADAFQFSRSFKRVYGIPPTQLVNTGR